MGVFLKKRHVYPVPPFLNSRRSCCRLNPLFMVGGGANTLIR